MSINLSGKTGSSNRAIVKIITQIKGGLGNQLFCYSAARRLALINHSELIIDNVSGFQNDFEYRRNYELDLFNIPFRFATPVERFEPFGRLRRKAHRFMGEILGDTKSKYIFQSNIDFMEDLLTLKADHDLYLDGYWQSEDYFKDISREIRTDLTIKPLPLFKGIGISPEEGCGIPVAVHVRFFDGPGEGGVHNVSPEYYKRAIMFMDKLIPGPHYYIFSDRLEEAKAMLSFSGSRKTFVDTGLRPEERRDVAEFWIMSRCQHFIIANSTFSWWAAWLGCNEDKIVIAPSNKIAGKTNWGVDRQIPDRWIKL